MYNLLAGYSFFFENYSADVINIILRAGREGQFSTLNIANETGLAMESISSFMEVLEQNGLITQSMPTNEDIETYRKRLAEMKKKQPSWTDTDVKDKLPMNISNAELAYSEAIDDGKTITSVMFELTYRCSEMCIHCYNPGATRNSEEISHRAECKELTLDDYKRIIDELCDLGLVKACLSGGDPFSKEITFDIIDYLYSKDIAIDIFTNGQRITKYVRKIAEYFPRLIGISIYSGIPEDHDAITRVNGSWRRSIQVVQELSELAVPMNLKCCIMQPNLHSYYLVAELARQYGAQPQFEINISESNDGDLCAKQLRLTEEQLQIVLRDHNLPLYVGREAPNFGGQKRDMFLRSCGAGTTGFCISPNGDFRACTAFIQVYGNLKETSALAILLHSDKLKEWRDSKVADYSECGRYGYCDYCNLCSGLNYTEHKDFRKPAETNCYMARARYNLAQKLMESDTPLNREEFVEALQKLPKAKVVLQRKYKTKG